MKDIVKIVTYIDRNGEIHKINNEQANAENIVENTQTENTILNEVNVNILDMVDKILLMTTNDPLDLKNLKTVLSLFKDSNINKYKVILNDSVANNRDYFSLYDLKVIIDNNIDYIISNKFYVPNMDAYVFDGKIFTLEAKKYPDEGVFNLIIKDAGGKDE